MLTRDKAIDYMKHLLARSDASIAFEVDRYASWPAQGLAYLLGAEAIASERARAAAALGPRFSAGAYDNMVLGLTGATAGLLTLQTDDFIARTP